MRFTPIHLIPPFIPHQRSMEAITAAIRIMATLMAMITILTGTTTGTAITMTGMTVATDQALLPEEI